MKGIFPRPRLEEAIPSSGISNMQVRSTIFEPDAVDAFQTYISNISPKSKSSPPSSSSGSALTLVKEALGLLKEADGAKAEAEASPTTRRARENFILIRVVVV